MVREVRVELTVLVAAELQSAGVTNFPTLSSRVKQEIKNLDFIFGASTRTRTENLSLMRGMLLTN